MKTIKRSIAFMLALVLTFAMSVTAFADEAKTYSITIDSAIPGHTYEAYQIFTGDLSEDETTLSNIKWGEGISKAGQDTLGSAKDYAEALAKIESNSDKATAEAEKLNGYLEKASQTVSVPADSTDVSYQLTGLKAGYYLIKDKDDSLSGSDKSYTEFILKLVKDQTVKPKSGTTTVEKKVKDINDTTDKAGNYTDWQDSADYDIGDVVPFQLTATLPANVESYKSYYLKFDDTLSQGLDFNEGTVTVKLGDKDVTSFFKTNYDAAGKKLTFTCDNILAKGFEAKNGDTIVVEYKATLNKNAVVGSEGNPNKVKLEFSNNPNNGGEGDKGETPEDTVIVFTYKVVINKVDENNKALDGAEFTLYKKIKGEADKEIKAVISGDKNDVFTFSGLDDGDYVLKETKTPDSYNTAKDIAFTITADHSIESDAPELNSLSGDKVTGNITLKADKAEGSLSTPVQNLKGSVLPSTGGAGRVAIYVIGAILVVGGGIVLVTKKRVK